jgi:hypothetical protein
LVGTVVAGGTGDAYRSAERWIGDVITGRTTIRMISHAGAQCGRAINSSTLLWRMVAGVMIH